VRCLDARILSGPHRQNFFEQARITFTDSLAFDPESMFARVFARAPCEKFCACEEVPSHCRLVMTRCCARVSLRDGEWERVRAGNPRFMRVSAPSPNSIGCREVFISGKNPRDDLQRDRSSNAARTRRHRSLFVKEIRSF
jgi:hypothetical protein